MELPLISVIIPAYNAECFIASSCRSVFSQTYPNWELVVVDDGSTDATLAILNQLAHSRRNMTVIHTENRGVSAARNTGMDAAKGEYISFLDADDKLTERALEYLLCKMQEGNYDITIGNTHRAVIWEGEQALQEILGDHLACHSACRKLYKMDLVREVRFVEGRHVNEDGFFVFQCFLKKPRVATITEPVYLVRATFGSASRSDFSEKFLDILYFAQEKKRLVEEQYPHLLPLTDNMLVKANMALLRNMCKTYDPKWRNQEKACIKLICEKQASFRPLHDSDKRWFWIITHGLFYVYKLYYFLRRKWVHRSILRRNHNAPLNQP